MMVAQWFPNEEIIVSGDRPTEVKASSLTCRPDSRPRRLLDRRSTAMHTFNISLKYLSRNILCCKNIVAFTLDSDL